MAVDREGLSEDDRARVAAVFEAHRRFIEAVATSQVNGDQAEAAEIVQDVAVRLCRRLNDLRSSAALQSWIYKLTVNAARDRRRARMSDAAGRDRFHALRAADPVVDPDEEVMASERRSVIMNAVRRLPPRQRSVIVSRFGLGSFAGDRSFAEVGRELGISVSHAHRVQDAAVSSLRESLENPIETAEDD